jgi:hypothetical protein
MKRKKLFNTSAYITSRILERVLNETGCRVCLELALSLVLDVDGDALTRQDLRHCFLSFGLEIEFDTQLNHSANVIEPNATAPNTAFGINVLMRVITIAQTWK